MKPEEQAREQIDKQLQKAGWLVVNRDEVSPQYAAVAVREELLQGNREADYLLLLYGKAVGIIEAKRADIKLNDPEVIAQAESYTHLMLPNRPCWERPLPVVLLANGQQIFYKNAHDPYNSGFVVKPRFPRPYDLQRQIPVIRDVIANNPQQEFALLPPLLPKGLRDCQYQAISAYEDSLRSGEKRALIVLATGAGKTFTACNIVYRLISSTSAIHRVLFLVDRNNLGDAALRAFQAFENKDGEHPFSDSYGVEQLRSVEQLQTSNAVFISTIQRLYSILSGLSCSEIEALDEGAGDDFSQLDQENSIPEQGLNQSAGDKAKYMAMKAEPQMGLPEQPNLPCNAFDLIIIDECHRSIYSTWRQVLDYFGQHAYMLGLTATPIELTKQFFHNNVVANYTLNRSIEDGINVPPVVYRIKTELSEHGGQIKEGEKVHVTSNYTGKTQVKKAETEIEFSGKDLNRSIIAPDQIRTIMQAYKEAVFRDLYPERKADFDSLPKTLIFAKDERHAKEIVEIAKEVFKRPENDQHFAQRITYSVGNSNQLIQEFRNKKDFRIAVTVTLVATGTDVPPLETLMFLTDVRSNVLYQQMKGRGVRTISDDHLREVTPNAEHKDRFVIVDAIGVTEKEKTVPQVGGKHQAMMTLERLLEELSRGVVSDDLMLQLAYKLTTIANKGDPDELAVLQKMSPQLHLIEFAQRIIEACEQETLPPFVDSNEPNTERKALLSLLLDDIPARKKLIEIAKGYFKELPEQKDQLLYAGFSQEEAADRVHLFEQSLEELAEEEPLFQRLKDNAAQVEDLSVAGLEELNEILRRKITNFSVPQLWKDYALLLQAQSDANYNAAAAAAAVATTGVAANEADIGINEVAGSEHVKQKRMVIMLNPANEDETDAPTNALQLTRFAWHHTAQLVSLANNTRLIQLFNLWCGQTQNDLPMDDEHKNWYRSLAQYIAINGAIMSPRELRELNADLFRQLYQDFGAEVNRPIESLNNFLLRA